jgi:hypothetical protein
MQPARCKPIHRMVHLPRLSPSLPGHFKMPMVFYQAAEEVGSLHCKLPALPTGLEFHLAGCKAGEKSEQCIPFRYGATSGFRRKKIEFIPLSSIARKDLYGIISAACSGFNALLGAAIVSPGQPVPGHTPQRSGCRLPARNLGTSHAR